MKGLRRQVERLEALLMPLDPDEERKEEVRNQIVSAIISSPETRELARQLFRHCVAQNYPVHEGGNGLLKAIEEDPVAASLLSRMREFVGGTLEKVNGMEGDQQCPIT